MEKNNTGKYLKYAIGEIVLVVIGILIALQINNWNEERKRANQEHKILLDLRSDFRESRERLVATMDMQQKVVKNSNALVLAYEGKTPIPPNDSIKLYLAYGAFAWYRAELITGAYDALINTGNSELIRNRDLLRKLADYYSILNSGFEDQESSMENIMNMERIIETALLPLAMPKLRKRIGLDTIPNPHEDEAIAFLFKQDAFFGHLYQKTILEHLRYTIQQDLLTRIEEILRIIDDELGT
jgi:hypothetical protein